MFPSYETYCREEGKGLIACFKKMINKLIYYIKLIYFTIFFNNSCFFNKSFFILICLKAIYKYNNKNIIILKIYKIFLI